jgi:guanylate kinase
MLVVISGPSGVGKTSLCREVLAVMPDVTQSVSCTTRAARPGERDGREYHFISREAFDTSIAAGDFLEWATVHEHLYGTLRQQVQTLTETGKDVLLAIDVQGAANLRAVNVDAVYIFLLPPSWDTLAARLQNRGSEDREVRARRLAVARGELRHYTEYDYVVYNDDLAVAANTLQAIILAERQRIVRVGMTPFDHLWQCDSADPVALGEVADAGCQVVDARLRADHAAE